MTTSKDFEAIASVFRAMIPVRAGANTPAMRTAWILFRAKMAKILAESNPRFDRERFIKACDPEERWKACDPEERWHAQGDEQ